MDTNVQNVKLKEYSKFQIVHVILDILKKKESAKNVRNNVKLVQMN